MAWPQRYGVISKKSQIPIVQPRALIRILEETAHTEGLDVIFLEKFLDLSIVLLSG